MSNSLNFISFEKWCFDTHNQKYLDLFDEELNEKTASEVAHQTNKPIYFKCPRGIHESSQVKPSYIVRNTKRGMHVCICAKCNSIGQYIIDQYGQDYLNEIWSDKNEVSYFDIPHGSQKHIWLRCTTDSTHPDYPLYANTFKLSHNCPYCVGKKVCLTNSLGYNYEDSVKYWSDKNDRTPFDYTVGSKSYVWFKCPDGIHDDYKRQIVQQLKVKYRCPECSKNLTKGENHYRWAGGVSKENEKIRHSIEYNQWKRAVYAKDNYTCQCCGRSDKDCKLEGHHLLDFATHIELRFDVGNSMSLCHECHNANVNGSFHNLYGTFYKTPDELEEYINWKRKQLGINLPFSIKEYRSGKILKPGEIEKYKEEENMGKTRYDRICTVCGEAYRYCPQCTEFDHLPRWHDAYDTENCKNLYNITAGWINGWLDKEVEIARLNKADLSKMDKFPQWMQDTIKEMQNYKPEISLDAVEKVMEDTYVIKTAEVKVEEPVMDEPKVEDKKAVHDFTKNGYKKIKPKYNK